MTNVLIPDIFSFFSYYRNAHTHTHKFSMSVSWRLFFSCLYFPLFLKRIWKMLSILQTTLIFGINSVIDLLSFLTFQNTNRNSSKQGGRLQVIANFFQNLAPTRRGSQSQNTQQSDSPVPPEQSTSHTDLLPPISSSHLIASKSHNTSYASHAYLNSPRDLSPGQKNSIVITNSPSPIRRTVEQFRWVCTLKINSEITFWDGFWKKELGRDLNLVNVNPFSKYKHSCFHMLSEIVWR